MTQNPYDGEPTEQQLLADDFQKVLDTLNPAEKAVIQLRFGIDSGVERPVAIVADMLRILPEAVRHYERTALEKLRHPERAIKLSDYLDISAPKGTDAPNVQIQKSIEEIATLTPELMVRLKTHGGDFRDLAFGVFEHFVAELLAANGFDEVMLLGQSPDTSADIFAMKRFTDIDDELRYFVEVKRWKDKVGVQVIDAVYGAMLLERPKHGWRAAVVVTSHDFTDFRKYRGPQLKNMGILLKDRNDLLQWLSGYTPNSEGLWVPPDHAVYDECSGTPFKVVPKRRSREFAPEFAFPIERVSLADFLECVTSISTLSPSSVAELHKLIIQGDRQAKLKMLRHHLYLVVDAAKASDQVIDEQCLQMAIENGNLELVRALEAPEFKRADDATDFLGAAIRWRIERLDFEEN